MTAKIAQRDVLRVIDANFNRSREGLRVCEEVSRFILRSPALTGELKCARHAISTIVKNVSGCRPALAASRDARADIGRTLSIKCATKKKDCLDLFSANIERVKESLRVLEEFFSLLDKRGSRRFLMLRFKVYEIEKRALKKIAALRNTR
ncbi:MAG: hypothetical protein JW919_00005 [Candidatus Omnitrophica bacterium]|nr:hypothetical protein [Candidatus Omnitrophota bacterium]